MDSRKNPDISVVIPAYNVEAYIERCVLSVVKGTFPSCTEESVEILIVEDGSTDDTGTICDSLEKKYDSVRVIHQQNGGLSAARNTGMAEAHGTYLLFLDGDDTLEPETLKTLYNTMEAEQLDALFFGAIEVDEPTGRIISETSYNRPHLTNAVMTGEQLFCEMVTSRNYIGCAVLYMVRKSLYEKQKLRFVPRLIHEDQVFTPQVLFAAKRAAYRNDLFYRRYNREGSIMRTVSHESETENYFRVVKELDEFVRKTPMEETGRECFYKHLTGFIKTVMVHYCRIPHPTAKQREIFREMKRMSHRKEISVSWKYRIYLWLVRMERMPVLGLPVRKTGFVKG